MPQLAPFAEEAFSVLAPTLRDQIIAAAIPSLGEGPHDVPLSQALASCERMDAAAQLAFIGDVDPARLPEWLSGLWLLAGDLDRSHSKSQAIDKPEGSFLHGIMHRREGDFSNAKYWFRRVGSHPLFTILEERTDGTYVDGVSFCDDVERGLRLAGSDAPLESAQWIEWQSLMVHCL